MSEQSVFDFPTENHAAKEFAVPTPYDLWWLNKRGAL
jgi:hypothetical protein